MAGNSATLKKSGERRCSSRDRGRLPLSLSPVVSVAVGTASSIAPLLAAVSSTSFPEIFSKCPRITEVPRCTASKYGKLWYGSTVKDSGAAAAVSGSAAAIRPAANLFDMLSSFCGVDGDSAAHLPGERAADSGHDEPEERQQHRLQPDRRTRAQRQACRDRHEREREDSVPRQLREDHGCRGEKHGDDGRGEHKGRARVDFSSDDHLHQQERARPGRNREAVQTVGQRGAEDRRRPGACAEGEPGRARAHAVLRKAAVREPYRPGRGEHGGTSEQQPPFEVLLREYRPENPCGRGGSGQGEHSRFETRRPQSEIDDDARQRRGESKQDDLARRGQRRKSESGDEVHRGGECGDDGEPAEAEGAEERGDDQRGGERRKAALHGGIGEHFLHWVRRRADRNSERNSAYRADAVIPSEEYRKTTGAPRASRTRARDWPGPSSSPSWDSGNRATRGRRPARCRRGCSRSPRTRACRPARNPSRRARRGPCPSAARSTARYGAWPRAGSRAARALRRRARRRRALPSAALRRARGFPRGPAARWAKRCPETRR